MHFCPYCNRSYERADHLSRHVTSHQNARVFKCSECSKGFNRRDILRRHEAAHERNEIEGKPESKRRVGRATRACEACAQSKSKCDESRPCKRCKTHSEICVDRTPMSMRPRKGSSARNRRLSSIASTSEDPGRRSSVADFVDPQTSSGGDPTPLIAETDFAAISGSLVDGIENLRNPEEQSGSTSMAPEFDLTQSLPSVQVPYDLLDFMNQSDHLIENIDTFDFDLGLDSFPIFDASEPRDVAVTESGAAAAEDQASSKSRFEIFKRTPWFWNPSSNQSTFSEHVRMPLEDENGVNVASSPHWPYSVELYIQDKLDQQARDRILQLVTRTVGTKVSIPSFPSAHFLDILVKNGIAKKVETDAWIHPHTFCASTTRTELLVALVAAGCVCFGIMSVGKTGGMLQEITRVALNNLAESDNSVLRDLQYLQAFMLWLDIGIFCGYKRKMEIAESDLLPLCTALRKAGAFNRSFYTRITPNANDSDAVLEQKWREWVKQESYKRLVYHLFQHDINVTFAMNRNPITSYSELSVPLPAARDIWLAQSPSAWRAAHAAAASVRGPGPIHNSLKDLLTKPDRISLLPGDADQTLSLSIFVAGIAALVWDHRKQVSITEDGTGEDDPKTHLWIQSRRQDLYQMLQNAQTLNPSLPAVQALFIEFLMMNLHVSLEDVQRFAGKFGEDEAQRSHAGLERWRKQRAARTAIWHAGQTLRAARNVPPYQLRGFDSIATYYATLTIWTYGVLHCSAGRRRAGCEDAAAMAPPIHLDGPSSQDSIAFVACNRGRAVLRLLEHPLDPVGTSCDILDLRRVMAVGIQVLEGNYPDSDKVEDLPPLILSLRKLMQDLGNLPS
ncbi:putative transcription factor with C2H2 and Zn(2)-Cys(6) DNA binding domain [Phyllosticta citricarpa]